MATFPKVKNSVWPGPESALVVGPEVVYRVD